MRKSLDEQIPQEITLPARAASVPDLIEFVASQARELAFDEKRVEEIRLALAETFDNILRFSCTRGDEEIRITCETHEMGALLLNIIDTGEPYNMLVLSAFPEVAGEAVEIPSTKVMKRVVKNIEYRRDGGTKTNILFWTLFG